jgi:hypothetical protein
MSILKNHNWTNKDIFNLRLTPIREYDMKDAGFSIIKLAKIFDKETIEWLTRLDKQKRNIAIGKMQKENPEITNILMDGFIQARLDFAKANDIADDDVLSIKKDAIFLINKIATNLKFGEIEFVHKNKYSSYYFLNDKEFYYSSWNKILTTKGLGSHIIDCQKNFFLNDLRKIMFSAERCNQKDLVRILKEYRTNFLKKELKLETYREMNQDNSFRINEQIGGLPVLLDDISENERDILDVSYNYIAYLIPLISLLV